MTLLIDTDVDADSARATYFERFGGGATVVVRSPGRVNLIGEHLDYSHLPVLPIAIDRALWVAAAATDGARITAHSTFANEPVTLEREAPDADDGWARYLAGALRELTDIAPGRGARLSITSDLPAMGGLSSSPALTLGVMAALCAAWEAELDQEDLVARAIRAERHVGVESGGMDQEVISFATAGHALRIDFEPPGRRNIAIPAGLRFVAAYSGAEAPKGGDARDAYNERVIGTRLAAAMLADQVGTEASVPPRLRDVVDIEVAELLADALPEKISPLEVAHGIHSDIEQLVLLSATSWDPRIKAPVRRPALHVLSEAARVDHAEAALLAGDLAAFGKLLDESHNSLREDMRCSTPGLDKVCAAMRKAGALGARLTGAGFGGFAMAAVTAETEAAVLAAAEAATGGPAFAVAPSDGYVVVRL